MVSYCHFELGLVLLAGLAEPSGLAPPEGLADHRSFVLLEGLAVPVGPGLLDLHGLVHLDGPADLVELTGLLPVGMC